MRNEARVFANSKGDTWIEMLWEHRFLNYLVRRAQWSFGTSDILLGGPFAKGMISYDSIEWLAFFKASNGDELLAIQIKENHKWNNDLKEQHLDSLVNGDLGLSTPRIRYIGIIKQPAEQKLIKDYLSKIGLAFEVYVAKNQAKESSASKH